MAGGYISTEFTVWCDKCPVWYQTPSVGSKAKTAKEFRRLGWMLIDSKWVCPECAKAHKENPQK